MKSWVKTSQPEEGNRCPCTGNTEDLNQEELRPTPRHIIIKMVKVKYKERIIKAAREKQRVIYKGTPTRLPVDFLADIS